MDKRQIKPVNDNIEKYYTYREYTTRHAKAMKEGFYFEAVLIDYAMMEDRLRSLLYHMGLMIDRKSTSIKGKRIKPMVQDAVARFKEESESSGIGITSITGKMRVIRCVLKMVSDENDYAAYSNAVQQVLTTDDIKKIMRIFEDITNWCAYRNEIIHCLLNKSIDCVEISIAEKAQNGLQLAREIDSIVRKAGKGNRIRKSQKLPIEVRLKVTKP